MDGEKENGIDLAGWRWGKGGVRRGLGGGEVDEADEDEIDEGVDEGVDKSDENDVDVGMKRLRTR